MKVTRDRLILLLWGTVMSLFLSLALAAHYAPFRIVPLRSLPAGPGLFVHHFLSYRCACSKKLLAHLTARGVHANTRETIHLIAPPAELVASLAARGFEVESLEEEGAVQKYDLAALPQLVIVRDGRTVYQGGYAWDQQHTRAYEDVRIIEAAAAQAETGRAFPVLGCANGHIAKNKTDLLKLKYE